MLRDLGIDIDSAENGAKMLKNEHKTMHTNEYYENVNKAIKNVYDQTEGMTKQERASMVITELTSIRQALEGSR